MYWMVQSALIKRVFEPSNLTHPRPNGKIPVYAFKHNPDPSNELYTRHIHTHNSPASNHNAFTHNNNTL